MWKSINSGATRPLSIVAQPQLNTFFNRVERLPEIKLTGLRQRFDSSASFMRVRRQLVISPGIFAMNAESPFESF